MGAPLDLSGMRFGKWTALSLVRNLRTGKVGWLCACECGTEQFIMAGALRAGQSTQCRLCSNREKAAMKSRLTHGASSTRLYGIWSKMKARCSNKNLPDYPRWGGRGISLCEEWLNDFPAFRDWSLSNGYGPHLTIDREDNDGNYTPDNCRWVTRKTQNRNRRDNRLFQWKGANITLAEIAEAEGMTFGLLRQRVGRDGLSIEEAVTRPLRRHPNRS